MKNNKYMSFPMDVVGNLPLSKLLMKEEKQPYLIKQAEDAYFLDTSDLSIEEVADKIIKIVEEKVK